MVPPTLWINALFYDTRSFHPQPRNKGLKDQFTPNKYTGSDDIPARTS